MAPSHRPSAVSSSPPGKAQAMGETEGFVKIISDKQTRVILGAHILSAEASDLIAVLTPFIKHKMTIDKLTEVIHAHPTLAETIHEAALSVDKKAIHAL